MKINGQLALSLFLTHVIIQTRMIYTYRYLWAKGRMIFLLSAYTLVGADTTRLLRQAPTEIL